MAQPANLVQGSVYLSLIHDTWAKPLYRCLSRRFEGGYVGMRCVVVVVMVMVSHMVVMVMVMMVMVQRWLNRRRLANGKVPLWSQEREDLPLDFSASRTGRSAGGQLEGDVKSRIILMIRITMIDDHLTNREFVWDCNSFQVRINRPWLGRSGTQRSERRARKFKTFWKKTLGSSRFGYCCLQRYLMFLQ